MNATSRRQWASIAVVSGLLCAELAAADALRAITALPASAWRDASTFEVAILGAGFRADSAIRFLVHGTDEFGGITVKQVRFASAQELIALVQVDASAIPGAFDIEIHDSQGSTVRAQRAFVVEPYSWVRRFGCTGAESWRRRIPCKRGSIY